MSNPPVGRAVLAYAIAFAVLFASLMVRSMWAGRAWRSPLCAAGFAGLAISILVVLNTLSVGGNP